MQWLCFTIWMFSIWIHTCSHPSSYHYANSRSQCCSNNQPHLCSDNQPQSFANKVTYSCPFTCTHAFTNETAKFLSYSRSHAY